MQKSVVVLFGGRSCENEVSVITGTMAANLLRERYAVYPVYIAQSGAMYTGEALFSAATLRGADLGKAFRRALFSEGALYALHGRKLRELCRPYCALNCCHGMGGEDGAVSGLLDLSGIPNASPDLAASALFMDKALTKLFAKALGIKTVPYVCVREAEYRRRGAFAIRCAEKFGYPVLVKPNRLGSSIGVTVARTRAELALAFECAFAYDSCVIAEAYLADRREINCAAYRAGGVVVVSPCEEVKTESAFLTFKDKYFDGGKEEHGTFPAELPAEVSEKVRACTKLLYRKAFLRGIVRADFLLSGGEVYFNEMNTVPGSLSWYFFSKNLRGFPEVLSAVLEQGVADARLRAGKRLLKNSGVLTALGGTGNKRRQG